MIKKRRETNNIKQQTATNNIKQQTSTKKENNLIIDGVEIVDINGIEKPTFNNYEDEAKYVVKLLKAQGTDIYDENRFGGMYLRQNKDKGLSNIFKNNKTVNNETSDNESNVALDNAALSEFFKLK